MRRSDGAVMALVTLVAALVRLPGLGRRGLWVDEAFTALAGSTTPAGLVRLLRHDSGPPLYYLFVQAAAHVAGTGEAVLRMPSALAGIASAVVVSLAARRLGAGAWSMLLAGLFIAISPILVHHAQDARYYAFLPLVAAGTLWLLERAIAVGASRGCWAAVALVLTAGAYLHAYGLLLVPGAFAYVLARRRAAWRPLAVAAGIALLLFVPWVPILVEQLQFGGTAWAGRALTPLAPLASLDAFMPGGHTPAHVPMPPSAIPAWVARAAGVALGLAAIGGVVRSGAADRARIAAPALFSLVPLVLVWGVSLLGRPVYVVGRADLIFMPGLVIALSLGLERLGRGPVLAGTAAVTLLAVFALVPLARADLKSGDRMLARAIAASARPGDVVVACGLSYAPLVHYLGDEVGDGRLTLIPFPADMGTHPGNLDVRATLAAGPRHVSTLEGALRAHLEHHPDARVWAALPPGPLGRTLGGVLDARLGRDAEIGTYRMGMIGAPLRLVAWRVPVAAEGTP